MRLAMVCEFSILLASQGWSLRRAEEPEALRLVRNSVYWPLATSTPPLPFSHRLLSAVLLCRTRTQTK